MNLILNQHYYETTIHRRTSIYRYNQTKYITNNLALEGGTRITGFTGFSTNCKCKLYNNGSAISKYKQSALKANLIYVDKSSSSTIANVPLPTLSCLKLTFWCNFYFELEHPCQHDK